MPNRRTMSLISVDCGSLRNTNETSVPESEGLERILRRNSNGSDLQEVLQGTHTSHLEKNKQGTEVTLGDLLGVC